MLFLTALLAHAQEAYWLETALLPDVSAERIRRSSTWLRVATTTDRSLGEVRVDCYGELRCRVNTSRLGSLRVTDAAFVPDGVDEGVEVEVIANGGSHWIWISPLPSP